MLKVVVGVVTFLLVGAFYAFIAAPWAFNLVSGLFESNDIGVVAGLLACVLLAVVFIWIAIAAIILTVTTTLVAEERRDFNRQVKRFDENRRRR